MLVTEVSQHASNRGVCKEVGAASETHILHAQEHTRRMCERDRHATCKEVGAEHGVDANEHDEEDEGVDHLPHGGDDGVENALEVVELVEDANDAENADQAHDIESGAAAAAHDKDGVDEGDGDYDQVEPVPAAVEEVGPPVAVPMYVCIYIYR